MLHGTVVVVSARAVPAASGDSKETKAFFVVDNAPDEKLHRVAQVLLVNRLVVALMLLVWSSGLGM